jgi:hypothetical protein
MTTRRSRFTRRRGRAERAAARCKRRRGRGRAQARRRATRVELETVWIEEVVCYGAHIPTLVKLLEEGCFE